MGLWSGSKIAVLAQALKLEKYGKKQFYMFLLQKIGPVQALYLQTRLQHTGRAVLYNYALDRLIYAAGRYHLQRLFFVLQGNKQPEQLAHPY